MVLWRDGRTSRASDPFPPLAKFWCCAFCRPEGAEKGYIAALSHVRARIDPTGGLEPLDRERFWCLFHLLSEPFWEQAIRKKDRELVKKEVDRVLWRTGESLGFQPRRVVRIEDMRSLFDELAPKGPFRPCGPRWILWFSLFSEEPHRVTSNDLVGALGAGPRPEGVGRPAEWLATVSRRCHSVDVLQRGRFLFPCQPPNTPFLRRRGSFSCYRIPTRSVSERYIPGPLADASGWYDLLVAGVIPKNGTSSHRVAKNQHHAARPSGCPRLKPGEARLTTA